MTISDEQRILVTRWVQDGASLSEVQRRLKEECEISLTYMETRFLVDDLKLRLAEPERPGDAIERLERAKAAGPDQAAPAGGPGGVRVTMDAVVRPGALVSGKVTFADGEAGEWYLDQTGRLGVNPNKAGYRPSQADLLAFQHELQALMASQGF